MRKCVKHNEIEEYEDYNRQFEISEDDVQDNLSENGA